MYWLTGLVGLAMIAAPWIFGYSNDTNPLWTSIILGAAVVLASGYKALMRDTQKWEYWVAGIAGILAVIAPFVLGFSGLTAALWALIIMGGLVFLLSGYGAIATQEPI